MKYTELIIKAPRNASELVQAVLLEAGFDSMQIDDPMDAVDIAEHQDLYKYDYINEEISQKAAEAEAGADAITITLYFEDNEEGRTRLSEAEKLLSGIEGVSFRTKETGDDSEWLYKWQEHFKPSKVGERIVVKPGWEDYEAAEDELVIEMEPGMAFGSGLHETTSMCIKALEKDLGDGSERSYDPARYPIKVLDVGTGTGILAMAAVLLGADEALGIDIDDEAVRVSNENIVKNGLEGRISIRHGNLMDGINYDPDIIVANLMADLVVMLSPAAAAQLRPGGVYITSGILDIKEDIVKKAIEDVGFDIIEVLADGEWRSITAIRR